MRTVVISDVHGTRKWWDVVKKEKNADKFVFLGDYFDAFHLTSAEICENFFDILDFKKSTSKEVVLLIGNHDFHYCDFLPEKYSGYDKFTQYSIGATISDLIKKEEMQIAHQQDNYLFTHAGVTNSWFADKASPRNAAGINLLFKHYPRYFGFSNSDRSGYGQDVLQGPLWVRPESLLEDPLDNVTHVVGHTEVKEIIFRENVIFTDSPDSQTYLVIQDGNSIVKHG